MLKEFRDFLNKGNVIDLAVAVIIGVAFGAIVNSLVNDIVMPLIGILLGGLDFSLADDHRRRCCCWLRPIPAGDRQFPGYLLCRLPGSSLL